MSGRGNSQSLTPGGKQTNKQTEKSKSAWLIQGHHGVLGVPGQRGKRKKKRQCKIKNRNIMEYNVQSWTCKLTFGNNSNVCLIVMLFIKL